MRLYRDGWWMFVVGAVMLAALAALKLAGCDPLPPEPDYQAQPFE